MPKKSMKSSNKNRLTLVSIVSFFAVTGVIYTLLSSAASVGPTLGFYMTTTTSTPTVGSQFDVKLYANTGTVPVKSVAALVIFDSSQVREDVASAAAPADPFASPPVSGFDVTFGCGPANGCRADNGKVAFGLTNTGSARRTGDGMYIGIVRFTALKAGATGIAFDGNNQTTGFLNPDGNTQATLDGRTIQNPSITAVTASGGGGTTTPPPPPANGGGTTTTTNTGGTSSTTTKKKSSSSSSSASNSGTQPATQNVNSPESNLEITPVTGETSQSSAPASSKKYSSATILLISAVSAAILVGIGILLFSHSARYALTHPGSRFHHNVNIITPGGVVGGSMKMSPPPPSTVKPTEPFGLSPPKNVNSPGDVITPNDEKPPKAG